MNNNIAESFKECKEPLTYKRVSATHPIKLYFGLDDVGRKSLIFITDLVDLTFQSTKLIEVGVRTRKNGEKAVCFSLIDDNECDIFYKFCEDIIEYTKTANDLNALKIINNKWNRWINTFKNPHSKIMTEKEIRGLIGELIILRDYLFDKYTMEMAIKSWGGPNRSHKDIEISNTWYEVKTCYQSSKIVEISSIEQLDSNIDGHLCIVELEDSNVYVDGYITLNKLIEQISGMILDTTLKEEFMKKVTATGYYYREEYDSFIYSCKSMNKYLVNDKFPRLKKSALPKEIATASYELLIPNLRIFLEEV